MDKYAGYVMVAYLGVFSSLLCFAVLQFISYKNKLQQIKLKIGTNTKPTRLKQE